MSSTIRLEDLRINQQPIQANMVEIQTSNNHPPQHSIINIRTVKTHVYLI
jgi:hypothetical protein